MTFFDASTGVVRQKLEWMGSLVSIVLSPDGDIVACGSQDNSVHFWRRSTAQDSMMSGYPGKPSALAPGASAEQGPIFPAPLEINPTQRCLASGRLQQHQHQR